MSNNKNPPELITNLSIRDYFYDSVSTAVSNQKQNFSPETVFYITNLLTRFSDSEQLFEITDEGYDIRPLALIYADAVSADNHREKTVCLKYLGDVALFISGLFSSSLNRSLIDVDYYIGMGENAYGYLADKDHNLVRELSFHFIYNELSHKFISVVEILNEVRDHMGGSQDDDLICLYESWLRSHSQYSAEKLRKHGIEPVQMVSGKTHH